MEPKPEGRNVAKESSLLPAVADPLAAWGAVARTITWAQGAECGAAYPLTLLALISIRTLMHRFLLLVSFARCRVGDILVAAFTILRAIGPRTTK